MRVSSRLFRTSVWLASTSLSLSSTLPALAQPAPPDQQQTEEGQPSGDPPAIAGRISVVSGTVSFHPAGDTTWSAASLNYPVTNGDGLWTEPSAHSEMQVGDNRIVMAGSTEFEIGALDASHIEATEAQGATFLQIQSLPDNQTFTLNSPRGAVQINTPGRYEVVAGDTNDATTVTVVEGAAHIEGSGVSLDVGPQQTATIGGADTFQGQVGAMQQDEFLQTELRQATAVQQQASRLPQQVQYMTGGTELAQYGSFQTTSDYGQVWYPSDVGSDWTPYSQGHWAYVAPWGWNWVDNEPWGFAPFHYGRWVQTGGRWGWCAGGGEPYGGGYPVYSPALVGFVGIGAGVAIGLSLGGGFGRGGGIGWVPLGYHEPYYPPYRVSHGYFDRINRVNVTNIRNYNVTNVRNVTINNYANRGAARVMPEGAMIRGERAGQFARPIPAAAYGQARPIFGRPPVRPTAETPNLSRAAAREYNVPVRAEAGRGRPGPAISAEPQRGRPGLRTAAPPANIRAVPAASVGRGPAAGNRPGEGERPGLAGRPGEAGRLPEAGRVGAPGPGLAPHAGELPALRNPGAGRPPVATPANPGPRGETRLGKPGEAERPAGAPGPRVEPRSPGIPALRSPGEGPAGADRHVTPMPTREGGGREGAQPAMHAPQRAVPPAAEAPHAAPRPEAPRVQAPRSEPRRVEAPHAEAPRPEVHRAEPRPEAPRAEAPRAAPRAAPPRMEAPRAAPRMEAPRAAPRMEAPRPAPHPQEPHPAAAPHPGGRPEPKK